MSWVHEKKLIIEKSARHMMVVRPRTVTRRIRSKYSAGAHSQRQKIETAAAQFEIRSRVTVEGDSGRVLEVSAKGVRIKFDTLSKPLWCHPRLVSKAIE